MKNIFLTGLALGIDTETCMCCNVNIDWMFNYPSSFLWLNKIYVSSTIWDMIMQCQCGFGIFGEGKQGAGNDAVKLIFEILNSVGLVEIIDIKDIITEEYSLQLKEQICNDLELITKEYSEEITDDEHLIYLGRYGYCIPQLWTTYASLILSRCYNSSCLLEAHEINYLKHLFLLKEMYIPEFKNSAPVIQKVLDICLPNHALGSNYLFDNSEACIKCLHEGKCKGTYLGEIEKQLFNLLQQREYDEIQQLNIVLNRICDDKFKNDLEISAKDVLRELSIEKLKIQKKINRVFPQISRWTNFTTSVSAALSLSAFFDKPVLAGVGGAGMILSQGVKSLLYVYDSKYKWVNFINSEKGMNESF